LIILSAQRLCDSGDLLSTLLDEKSIGSYLGSQSIRGERMSQFDDRERAFEAKYARDEEMQFRITARRNRLLGEWAARQMELSEAESEAYAKDVVRSDFEEAGDHDVIRKVLGDLTAANVDCDEDKIREALRNKEIEARRQIIEASNS